MPILRLYAKYFTIRPTVSSVHAIQIIIKSNQTTVKEVYYPKYGDTRRFYDAFRTPNGGYGGLFSVTFHSTAAAVTFFDAIEIAKGPSLGTNFTLW